MTASQAPAKPKSSDVYIRGLDGLRAISIIIVFLSHDGFEHVVPGGFGVTIFFFLSGFLITTLLLLEQDKRGKIDLKAFYLRRLLRIFPPMYFALAFAALLMVIGINKAPELSNLAILAHLAQFTNYYTIKYGTGSTIPGMAILWSLSVEEHFYLLFPLALIFLLRRYSREQIAKVLVGVCVAVLMWRFYLIVGQHWSSDRTYPASDTRIDSIMWGCILALWRNPALDKEKGLSLCKPGLLAGAFLTLLFCLVFRNGVFRETLRYSLQGTAFFPIFAGAMLTQPTALFSFLELRWMRYLGQISYSFYLLHLPILLGLQANWVPHAMLGSRAHGIVAQGFDLLMIGVVGFALSVGLSSLVLVTVERPCAALRKRLSRTKALDSTERSAS